MQRVSARRMMNAECLYASTPAPKWTDRKSSRLQGRVHMLLTLIYRVAVDCWAESLLTVHSRAGISVGTFSGRIN